MRKLSELLAMYRTDRPDEWTMDEFKRAADALEAENARLRAEIDAANAQEPSWYEIHIPVNEKPDLLKSLSECHESYHAKAIRHYARPIPAQQSPAAGVPDEIQEALKLAITLLNDDCSFGKADLLQELLDGGYLQSPRITEQDARKIALSAWRYWVNNCDRTVDNWIEDEGRDLTNKINEAKHD